jgi:hypothetical protein
MNDNRPLRSPLVLLWGLAAIPPLIAILTEINKTQLIWYIRVVDFYALVLTAPFYLASFLALRALACALEDTESGMGGHN